MAGKTDTPKAPDPSKPVLHRGVDVKLPHRMHPNMPLAHGLISRVFSVEFPDLTEVMLYPSELSGSCLRIRVPHETKASAKSGWWRYS